LRRKVVELNGVIILSVVLCGYVSLSGSQIVGAPNMVLRELSELKKEDVTGELEKKNYIIKSLIMCTLHQLTNY
jgi:hypothetical protein